MNCCMLEPWHMYDHWSIPLLVWCILFLSSNTWCCSYQWLWLTPIQHLITGVFFILAFKGYYDSIVLSDLDGAWDLMAWQTCFGSTIKEEMITSCNCLLNAFPVMSTYEVLCSVHFIQVILSSKFIRFNKSKILKTY